MSPPVSTPIPASTLHVTATGPGAPLVLVHGWALHGGVFASITPALARNHHVISVDLPGHGHSRGFARFALEPTAEALANTIPDNSSVLGWSLGGMVALTLARLFPQKVKHLILVAANASFVQRPDWPCAMKPALLQSFSDDLANDYAGTVQRFLGLAARGDSTPTQVLRELRSDFSAPEDGPSMTILQDGLAVLLNHDARAELAALHCPVLMIFGGRDSLVPLACGERMRALLPAAELDVFPSAGHAPFLSHAAAFAERLQRFVA